MTLCTRTNRDIILIQVFLQDLELIKEQVACLQTRLNEVDHVARIAAERIMICAGKFVQLDCWPICMLRTFNR